MRTRENTFWIKLDAWCHSASVVSEIKAWDSLSLPPLSYLIRGRYTFHEPCELLETRFVTSERNENNQREFSRSRLDWLNFETQTRPKTLLAVYAQASEHVSKKARKHACVLRARLWKPQKTANFLQCVASLSCITCPIRAARLV